MNNDLAIIIPYYKKKYFAETLESLASQTDQRFKVYIGDDCSPESPSKIIEDYKTKINLLYHRFETNIGGTSLVQQWQRCIELSDNEPWVMVLGDDDMLQNNLVENFYNNLQEINTNQINVVRFASQNINEKSEPISKIYTHPVYEDPFVFHMRVTKGKSRSTLTEQIFARSSYEKYGFKDFPVAFGSDNVAWLEFPDGSDLFTISNSAAYIRVSPEHLSSKKDTHLRDLRRKGVYQFKRYVVEKYGKKFSQEDREIILKRAYKDLRYSRDNKETFNFLLFMVKHLELKRVIRIIKENRK